MRARLPWIALSAFLIACGSAEGDDSSGEENEPVDPETIPATPAEKLATGIQIREVSVYQAVKIPIMVDGQVAGRNVPVVAGRPGLLRVFVEPTPEWQPREIIARLEIATQSGEVFPPQEIRRGVTGPSFEDDLGSTFSFDIPPEHIRPDSGYSVALYEVDSLIEAPGNSDTAAWPADVGKMLLGAEQVGPLKVMLVPIQYYGDSSGRLPDLGEEQIQAYRDAFMKLYPVPDVQVNVREPLAFTQRIEPFGGGWQQLLQTLLVRRSSDGVADDVYYYGLFNPTDSIFQFCQQGCVAGLSLLPGATDVFARGSIGLGYGDGGIASSNSSDTMVHEIGHAHGRGHAPCGLGGQRAEYFPHPNATLGTWGFDIIEKRLHEPGSRRDLMSYCQPYWISDYNYGQIFERSVTVNSFARIVAAPGVPSTYRILSVGMNGELEWSSPLTIRHTPVGEPQTLEVVDTNGATTNQVTGYFYPYDHLPGGIVLAPEAELTGHAVRYQGKMASLAR